MYAVDRAWDACNVFPMYSLDRFTVYLIGLPALTVVNTSMIAIPQIVFHRTAHPSRTRWVAAVWASLVLIGFECIFLSIAVATPDHIASLTCVANVPGWWPRWLPV